MKTKEFIRQVEELGLVVQVNSKATFIRKHHDGKVCAVIDERNIYSFDTFHCSYDDLENSDKSKLFNLLVEYASTPIEKRKEEKKYYIRFKHFGIIERNYLNYYIEEERMILNSKQESDNYKTKFTLSELPDWAKEMLEQGHLVKEEVENE